MTLHNDLRRQPLREIGYALGKYLPPMPQPIKYGYREGVGWKADEITEYLAHGGWIATLFSRSQKQEDHSFMELEEAATSSAKSVAAVVDAYMSKVSNLKAQLQNDSASIRASVDRIEKEHNRLSASFKRITDMMTSGDFVSAIHNAERLAKALESISELGSSSLTFAVIDKKQAKE